MEQETSIEELTAQYPYLVLTNCCECGTLIKFMPFGVNTIDGWIEIFNGYKEEEMLCANCQAVETGE